MVKVGDSVVVSDPKHKDSMFEHSFIGLVLMVDALGADVEDQKGDVWSVMYDEIEEVLNCT